MHFSVKIKMTHFFLRKFHMFFFFTLFSLCFSCSLVRAPCILLNDKYKTKYIYKCIYSYIYIYVDI